ncbi:MAG: type II toxin-antitoxin system RelE/ParE family toxin [Thermoanaerobaculia bacterium]
MRLAFRPSVERDLDEATRWYEERQPGLRERFLEDVENVLSRIEDTPDIYQAVYRDIRRAPLRHFRYGVYYARIKDEILILAVVHDARHPSVWRRRR